MRCALRILASTLLRGTYNDRSNAKITRVTKTVKTENAAFSKSVSCTSIGRNSVRQPGSRSAGLESIPPIPRPVGGLSRTVFQFVLWRLSKWSVAVVSSTSSIRPSNNTNGSRTKRWATCRDNASSTPAALSLLYACSSIGASTSQKRRTWPAGPSHSKAYLLIEEYLDRGSCLTPEPASLSSLSESPRPSSAGVRSSTDAEMMSHLASVAARTPRQHGDAAVNASMTGASAASWS
mmetsp:Transcript_10728/g.31626  ORF Transcript_10728/g.31626 Transcript_10728/m.31626 type:complete len:236 (-) Transcript_10728:1009-1716(-)